MSLHWTIDSLQRLVTVTADGEVTRAEFENFLDAVDSAGAHNYRKLFDGLRGETSGILPEDVLALGVRMRTAHETLEIGALAAVVPADKIDFLGRVLGILAAANRPMRVFRQLGPAREWILKQR